jgi:putative RecB family exonuclease
VSLIVEVPNHLSHSSADNLVGSYCSASLFFGRYLGKPEIPGWAQIGGSALHAASEDWDNLLLTGEVVEDPSALQGMFEMSLDIEIKKTEDKTPYPKDEWHRSGRQGANFTPSGGPNKKDEAWWRRRGPEMLASWAAWRLTSGWEIAIWNFDEGGHDRGITPGIEIPFEVDIAGIPVKGCIDRVFEKDGEYLVVDLKSGREPDSTAQLGTYREGLIRQYGIAPRWGCYWLGETGLSTSFVDLAAKWPSVRVERRFTAARRRQLAGEFDPKPSNLCGSCGVREFCAEFGGSKAAETPQPWEITEVRIAEPRT